MGRAKEGKKLNGTTFVTQAPTTQRNAITILQTQVEEVEGLVSHIPQRWHQDHLKRKKWKEDACFALSLGTGGQIAPTKKSNITTQVSTKCAGQVNAPRKNFRKMQN